MQKNARSAATPSNLELVKCSFGTMEASISSVRPSLGRTASKIKWTRRAKVAKVEKKKPKAPKKEVKKKVKSQEKKKAEK